jgi:hypothetical protein
VSPKNPPTSDVQYGQPLSPDDRPTNTCALSSVHEHSMSLDHNATPSADAPAHTLRLSNRGADPASELPSLYTRAHAVPATHSPQYSAGPQLNNLGLNLTPSSSSSQ